MGALLVPPSGERFEVSEATGFGTNNEAEYQALIALLKMAVEHQVSNLIVFGDSQLIVNQVNGQWDCNAPGLYSLMTSAKSLRKKINRCDLRWIPREKNKEADLLSKKAIGAPSGDGSKRTPRKSSLAFGSQTDIGKKLGCSAIAVGKWLDAQGFREGKMASKKAVDAGLANNCESIYGVKTEWHIQKVVKTIREDEAKDDSQSSEDMLQQAEGDMGLPPGTLDHCMGGSD